MEQPHYQTDSNVNVQSAAEVMAERDREAAASQNEYILTSLAEHIRGIFATNKDAKKKNVETILEQCRRQYGREYDDDVKQAIARQGGSDQYVGLTSRQCRALRAWLMDNFVQTDDKPWSIEPTAKPDLDPQTESGIVQKVMNGVMELFRTSGTVANPNQVYEAAKGTRKEVEREITAEAKERARNMEKFLEDRFQDGSLAKALKLFFLDLSIYPAAFVKGPVVRGEKVLEYNSTSKNFDSKVKLIEQWERVSPWDIFPAPGARDIQDGDLIERFYISAGELYSLIGVPGYNEKEIRAILEELYGQVADGLGTGSPINNIDDFDSDTSQDAVDVAGKISERRTNSLLTALEFHGSASGKMLAEWGMKIEDELAMYDICAVMINNHVIKAQLNTNILGRKPYYATSVEKNPDSVWGEGIAQKVRNAQRGMNATRRSIVNNLSLCSGPQAVIDTAAFSPKENFKIYPLKSWLIQRGYTPTSSSGKPVEFFQPDCNLAKLQAAQAMFSEEADEESGIPKYMQGSNEGSKIGAAGTARGLSMLMNAANKFIKQTIGNVDEDVIKLLVSDAYYYYMMDDECPEKCKGDMQIIARGTIALTVKEQIQAYRNEFLSIVLGNEIVMRMVGPKGLAALLREMTGELNMEETRIIPDDEELDTMEQADQQQAMAQACQELLTAAVKQGIIDQQQFQMVMAMMSEEEPPSEELNEEPPVAA